MPAAKAPPAVKPAAIQPAGHSISSQPAVGGQSTAQSGFAVASGPSWKTAAAPGQPVAPSSIAPAETRFGHDFSRVRVQAKLQVNEPGDEYEREADRMAEIVARPQVGYSGAIAPLRVTPFIQRGPVPEPDHENEIGVDPHMLAGAGSGRPLPDAVRSPMEDRFGVKLGAVRVHTGTAASRLADEIDALAFTHGRNIYFADGHYAPGTPAGDRLLGHELTHVIQQSGGASGPGPVQRRIRGRAFHAGTETRFLAANKNIVTEAPLPGATTEKQFDFEAVGFPDLYRGAPDKAIGVRGKWEQEKDTDNPTDDPNKKHGFDNLKARQRKAESASGAVTYSPTVQGAKEPFTAEFPAKVEVGDIKPIWMLGGIAVVEHAGTGTGQLANYQEGFKQFAGIAAAEKKVTRLPTTDVLKGLTIPPELDYKNFDKENKSPSGNKIVTESATGLKRYWMFEPPGTGLYYYFSLPHPNPAAESKAKLEETFKKLEPVKKELRTPDDGIHSKAGLPKLPKRRTSGAKPNAAEKKGGKPAPSPAPQGKPIQRKETPRVKKDWATLGKAWEQKRSDWDTQSAKPLLSSKEGKALKERVAINNVIGLKNDTSIGSIAQQGRDLNTVELWSGTTGVLLGKLRFLMGGTFDKVAAAFDWVKEKLAKIWTKLTGVKAKFGGVGWRATLVHLLTKAIKVGFRELISVFFELCANCLEGIIRQVIGKFTEDISDNLTKEIAALRENFEKYEKLLKTEVEKRFGSWDKLIGELEAAEKVANIVFGLEALIRLGMQAVACLTPPALGCIWGLVVQVGLEVALSLIMGTEWFQQNVINHPSVRSLIKEFAGPTIRSLIADTLREVGLDSYATDVKECHQVEELEVPPVPPVEPVTPEQFQAHRAKWEQENRPRMLADLQFRFHSRIGVPATEAELEKLVAAMQHSGKDRDGIKRVIDSTPKWSNGKFDLGGIRRGLGGVNGSGGSAAPGADGDIPSITKPVTPPSTGPRLRFGPLDPVPNMPGSDRNRGPGSIGPRLEF